MLIIFAILLNGKLYKSIFFSYVHSVLTRTISHAVTKSEIRLYFTLSDFNAIFHLFLLCMCTCLYANDTTVFSIKNACNFSRILVFWSNSTLWVLFNTQEKAEEKCVFMVTTEMLIAHEKWMIGKVNFCFKWYRDPDIHITQTHRCEFESVKLQTEWSHRKQMYERTFGAE